MLVATIIRPETLVRWYRPGFAGIASIMSHALLVGLHRHYVRV
jgi:hypothetical protein